MDTETITDLRSVAEQVGRSLDALDAAGAAALAERATILHEVIQAVGPALRALASQVGLASVTTSAGTIVEPAPWRGLYLGGAGPTTGAPTVRGPISSRGRYSGTRLMLRQDGELVELVYDGPWSTVPGEVSRWKATERIVSPVEAVKTYGLDRLIGEMETALRKQFQADKTSSGAERRVAKLADEADRLRALRILIRGWR